MSRRRLAVASLASASILLAACSSDATDPEPDDASSAPADDASDDSGASDGDAVRIGMINMENSPLLSAPEVRLAAEAAADYVNAELGGIDGHPLELVTCIVSSAEQAQTCAQQMAEDDSIISVINGVNAFNGFFDFYGTLGGKPVIGGVPLFPKDFREPSARYFFGGSLSAFAGIGLFAVEELGAENVAVLYGQNAAGDASRQALAQFFESSGTTAEYVPVPTPSTDVTPQVTQVADDEYDAVIVVTAAAECAPVMQAADQLGITREKVIYTGTCNAEDVLSQAGAQAVGSWMHFTLYGTDQSNVPEDKLAEAELTIRIYEEYGDGEVVAGGLAVLGLASVLNVAALYEEIGFDDLDAETILATIDDGTPRNSHAGTDYACDNPVFTSVCNGDNFFAPITEDFVYEVIGPFDALEVMAQAAAG